MASIFDVEIPGVRFVELRWGESLQELSARELSDASLWVDIANLNDLRPPYVTDDPVVAATGVALYGSALAVPATSSVGGTEINPDLLYGRDVDLSSGKLTATNGDFTLATGLPNLRHALERRIITDQSELLFHLDYGCLIRRLLGTASGPIAGLLAGQYVKAALLADSRVRDVDRVDVSIVGDSITVEAQITPITGRRVDLEVVV
jgi:hypothetical protein